jgi:uncharacterized protein YbjT (DUF2867 family)
MFGDMEDLPSLERACARSSRVISTANAVVPRRAGEFGDTEVRNYQNLLTACRRQKIEHLVYVSGLANEQTAHVPETRVKHRIDRLIVESGVPYTIFRAAAFMDVYFSSIGSSTALIGVARPTARRGHWFPAWHARLTEGLVERRGIALIPGDGTTRHPFICVRDVASFLVGALSVPGARNRIIDLGGPEALSWSEVVAIHAEILDRPIFALRTPATVYRVLSVVCRAFSPVMENILRLFYVLGRFDQQVDMTRVCAEFDIELTSARRFLERQRAHPAPETVTETTHSLPVGSR